MQYFKNSQLKKQYSVSYTAINNWIRAAKAGKLDLQLHDEVDKSFILDTAKNRVVIEDLVARGKKYKNTRSLKVVTPKPEFYKLYSRKQIFDIITNIDIHREIPRQYNYFDRGAEYWDRYTQRLSLEDSANLLNSTVRLLRLNRSNIDMLLAGRTRINVVDIGPGNGLPVKDLLEYLLEKGVLARYIAIDISKKMLQIVEKNIKEWFGGRVHFEGHIRDITYERFDDLLVEDTLREDASSSANLLLFLGGTMTNFRVPEDSLKVIYNSMGQSDILLYSDKLDSISSRRYFDFSAEPQVNTLSLNHRLMFDLLNIDDSFFEVETGFDDQRHERFILVRLKVALSVNFTFDEGARRIDLNKGETILLWRAWQGTNIDVINHLCAPGFALLFSGLTQDREYFLAAAAIDIHRA